MITTATIVGYDGSQLIIEPDDNIDYDLFQKQVGKIEIRLNDGRTISVDQRKKTFAIIRDISLWCGHDPEELRAMLTWDFRGLTGTPAFSLSDVDMTTARQYINYLVEFCFTHNIGTRDSLLNRTDDIGKYLYQCLCHRKCAICNKPAEIHHVDRVGMGRDRESIIHIGLEAIALCSDHHDLAHQDEKRVFEHFHIYGIKLDEYLCKRLRLNTK